LALKWRGSSPTVKEGSFFSYLIDAAEPSLTVGLLPRPSVTVSTPIGLTLKRKSVRVDL